jgi:hypothetical protein
MTWERCCSCGSINRFHISFFKTLIFTLLSSLYTSSHLILYLIMGSCFSSSSSIPNTLEVRSKYFSCDICIRTFSFEKKLRDYRMSKHGGKFKCFKCKKKNFKTHFKWCKSLFHNAFFCILNI